MLKLAECAAAVNSVICKRQLYKMFNTSFQQENIAFYAYKDKYLLFIIQMQIKVIFCNEIAHILYKKANTNYWVKFEPQLVYAVANTQKMMNCV